MIGNDILMPGNDDLTSGNHILALGHRVLTSVCHGLTQRRIPKTQTNPVCTGRGYRPRVSDAIYGNWLWAKPRQGSRRPAGETIVRPLPCTIYEKRKILSY